LVLPLQQMHQGMDDDVIVEIVLEPEAGPAFHFKT
jgi:hypothetical protein